MTATYADWAASRQQGQGQGIGDNGSTTSAPVRLVLDDHGDYVQDMGMSDEPFQSTSGGEQVQQDIVYDIRAHQRSGAARPVSPPLGVYKTVSEQMQAWSNKAVPASTILLVIDTNWLLSHLRLFEQLQNLIPSAGDSFSPVLFILPVAVLKELDGLKNASSADSCRPRQASQHTPGIATLARTASTFILDVLRTRPDLFRGQRSDEGAIQGAVAAVKSNDERILDCCIYFQRQGNQVGLLSDDKILSSQATVAGVAYMNYIAAEDGNPEAFLHKLHPELLPYFKRLRDSQSSSEATLTASSDLNLDSLATQSVQMQQSILNQQMAAIAHLEQNFPVVPSELLDVMSAVTSSLLVPVIYPVLLHYMANDNLEIFAYMLRRSSIFRNFRAEKDEDVLDCARWNAAICLRLIDQNWQMCFADRIRAVPSHASTTANGAPKASGQGSSDTSSSASLSQSRWASPARPSGSSFSQSTTSAASSSSSTKRPSFHPSKLPALASAFSCRANEVVRWSPARWRLVVEDLELLLCETSMLADHAEGRAKAELLLNAVRKNVDAWKVT